MGKKLYNYVDAPEHKSTTGLIDGKSDGIMDPNKFTYPIYYDIYKLGVSNDWTTDKDIDFTPDKSQYPLLTDAEKRLFDLVYAHLVFMDSSKTVSDMANVIPFITAPEALQCISRMSYEESNHSTAYYNNIEAIAMDPNYIYRLWHTDPILKKKDEFVGSRFEKDGGLATEYDEDLERRCAYEFALSRNSTTVDTSVWKEIGVNPQNLRDKMKSFYTLEEYVNNQKLERLKSRIRMVIANRLLEGVYFLSGFTCIYALGRMNKMTGSVNNIRLINRDEDMHLPIYMYIFKHIREIYPDVFTKEFLDEIKQMFVDGSAMEIEWGRYLTKDQILGLRPDDLEDYIKYCTNVNVKELELDKDFGLIYPEVGLENPLPWVNQFKRFNDVKSDFFQAKVMNYDESGIDMSVDDI